MKFRCLIVFSFLSAVIYSQKDSLLFDPLFLNEVVITDYGQKEKLITPVSLTTLETPADYQIQGAASLLSQIPGIFSDASTGEAFSRVYTRGISLSAEDDIGWYYMSLQEDGLPITAIHYNQFAPDFFLRPDVSHQRLEVLKGGKSSILAPSGPAGIVNFISEHTPDSYETHDRLTTGVYAGGRPMLRVEGFSGGPIGSSRWAYDISYLYRYDRGPRKIDYSLNNGGQFKIGLKKILKNGIVSGKFKWLKDKVNRFTGVAAMNWEDPEPAFNQSFQNTSLLPPSFEGSLPILEGCPGSCSFDSYEYNPSNGINARELSGTLNIDFNLGDWRLTNKTKYSDKSLNWQTAIGGQPLGLDNFISYFVSGDPFPIGIVEFTDVRENQSLATVNNQGAFAVLQGGPPSFEYVDGSLPNDAIMGSGTWYKDDSIDEWMNQLTFRGELDNIDITLGSFFARSDIDIFTNASFIYTTYEPQPRLLNVSLTGFDGVERLLSDENGLSNYGGLFYEKASISANQFAFFGDLDLLLTNQLSGNVGLRFEQIEHSGIKDISGPVEDGIPSGGWDGNPLTSYDASTLVGIGQNSIDASYSHLSYSYALDYQLNAVTSLFGRYSLGNKAPELNYYLDNFSNQEVPEEEPPSQTIRQLEFGIKKSDNTSSVTLTAYVSKLGNVAYSNFVFDPEVNQIFYTPTQFNSSQTIGIEFELGYSLSRTLQLIASATLQDPQLSEFSLYDANGTLETNDDSIADFSENEIPHNPRSMARIGLVFNNEDWYGSLAMNSIGKRFGNLENSFTLPSFLTVDFDMSYAISKSFAIGLRVKNALNSAGLTNFFGPNQFGSNSDAATAQFIAANPNASFVVFPIMPRAIYFSVDYTFNRRD